MTQQQNNGQTLLNFAAAERAEIEAHRPQTPREKFEQFDRENPGVYWQIRGRALELKRAGFARWSIMEIWQWLRWSRQCKTTGKPYALNNNFTAYYADKLMAAESELVGFFERRPTTAADRPAAVEPPGGDE